MKLTDVKYRIWSKTAEEFLYSDNGIISSAKHDCSDSAIRLYLFWEEILKDFPEEYDHDSLHMFTGLQDKNGKDIYEGDFIGLDGELKGYIQDAWTWVWGFKCLDQFKHLKEMEGLERGEVIGNVRENIDMVKEFVIRI